jgi:hypothetical protein
LEQIVAIKSFINLGLSDQLKAAFPDIIPVSRPVISRNKIMHPYWLSGFVSGEGCFSIFISKSTTHKSGLKITLSFTIGQDLRYAEFMLSIVNYLSCGYWRETKSRSVGLFVVNKVSDIGNKIIPFFENYPIQGKKLFALFKKAY